MRLWHKDLIPILPDAQLVGQWRELSAIAGAIKKNGNINHGLVNFVLDYHLNHFVAYSTLVREEMERRGFKYMDHVAHKIDSLVGFPAEPVEYEILYGYKMDDFYKRVCLYNLMEKVSCGMIKGEEAKRIEVVFYDKLRNCEENNYRKL